MLRVVDDADAIGGNVCRDTVVAGRICAGNDATNVRTTNATLGRGTYYLYVMTNIESTVVVDAEPEVAEARRRARGGSAELFEDLDLQARLARADRQAEDVVPGDRIVHIDGGASMDEVHRAIVLALLPAVDPRAAAARRSMTAAP